LEQFKISAREFLEANEFENALESLEQCLEEATDDIEVFDMLGDAYKGLNEIDASIEAYTNALTVDPAHLAISLKLSETSLAGVNYLEALKAMHQSINPKRYVEIGVCKGGSFQLADPDSIAIGIDPEPQLDLMNLPEKHKVIAKTSDDYFNSDAIRDDLSGKPFDLAFLDGMHQFEFALRDFINLEKYADADSIICIHDVYPLTAVTASRERSTAFWSGDIWKLSLCLKEYRPDLAFSLLPCPPTGLGVVSQLDADSSVLIDNYDAILAKYMNMPFEVLAENKSEKLSLVDNRNPLFAL
jgi:tetratricopeptide (TPR) repeat protein